MGSIPNLSILKGPDSQVLTQNQNDIALQRLFEKNAQDISHASRLALIAQNKDSKECIRWTYAELDAAANRLARAILKIIQNTEGRCNQDGDFIVAVSIPPSCELIITLLAIWKTGAAYLPLDVQAPANRIQHILNEAKPVLVISHQDNCNENELYKNVNVVSFKNLEIKVAGYNSDVIQDEEMLPSSCASKIAIILYTSGSTGIPKGVRISQRAIYNRLQWQWKTFPYSETEEKCAFKTALTFVDSVSEIWAPLLGVTPKSVLVISKETTVNPEQLIATLEDHKIERLVLVPSLLRAILFYLDLNKANTLRNDRLLERLKLWVCSGEPLVPSLVKDFFSHFGTESHIICNFYGSTEVMGDITFEKITKFEDDVIPIGSPVDNNIVYLLDDKLNPVACGEIGEVYCAGRNLASGYVNNRDANRFIPNPHTVEIDYATLYRTGDYGKIVNGVLIYQGRTDSQVKVRGHRVDLSEIENTLHKISFVDKVCVLCHQPGEFDQAILAFITLQDTNGTVDSIEHELKQTLPPYSMPLIKILDKIPQLNNGKTDRQLLLKLYAEETSSECGKNVQIDLKGVPEKKIKAAQCLFKTVASILGGSLKSTVINKEVGFYDLGGNSLNSIYTITKLRDQGFVIGITEFITSKTLGDILEKIRDEDETSDILKSNDFNNNKGIEEKFVAEILENAHREPVTNMIADSFCEKGDLEQCIYPRIERDAYVQLLNILWSSLVKAGLSFAIKRKDTGEYIGVSLNFDLHAEPEVAITTRLTIIFDFLEYLEGPIRDFQLPQGTGKILHSFMMGTHKDLNAQENVQTIQFMEEEVLKLARLKGFVGIFTTNSSPLTQQLGTDIFNYEVLHDYQVNKYVASDGSKPFSSAPDDQRAVCSLKRV